MSNVSMTRELLEAAKKSKVGTFLKGAKGAFLPAAFIALETFTTGEEYGYGYGFLKGASYNVPYLGQAVMLYEIGKSIGDAAYDYQKERRRVSLSKGFQDPYGNSATMRARSQHNLNRGRSLLGNEAYLFH